MKIKINVDAFITSVVTLNEEIIITVKPGLQIAELMTKLLQMAGAGKTVNMKLSFETVMEE